jgi:hypothetical protein
MTEKTLTEGERRVLADAASGELVDLEGLPYKERVVSADVIRRLCVRTGANSVDSRGIRVQGARVAGQLDVSFCTIPHPLLFASTIFDEAPDLTEARLPALLLDNCVLPGLTADGIQLRALDLPSIRVGGEVSLVGATLGRVDCSGATIANAGALALVADGAEIRGGVFLRGFSAWGGVRLVDAMIGGPLDCKGATLTNAAGDALTAAGAEIKGSVSLENGIAAGTVRLLHTTIGGNLDCEGATLMVDGGDALIADRAEIAGDVFLRDGFSAMGGVRFHGAKIGGQLDCSRSTMTNQGGRALSAELAEIKGAVLFRRFWAIGVVVFRAATIGGPFDCSHAILVNRRGPVAFLGRDAVIGGALFLRAAHVTGGVDLFHASAATLDDDLGASSDSPLGSWQGVQPLNLDGFVYARFGHGAEWNPKLRRSWLKQTTNFQPGAWQQLIDVYRAHGRDGDAKGLAIAMHNDRTKRALPWYTRPGRWLLRLLIGHGYRPWLAGVWALLILIAFGFMIGQWKDMFKPAKQGVIDHPQPAAYAVDAFLPVVDLGQTDRWTATKWMRWVDWSVVLLGWSLTTLFVAGFTGIVRNE